MDFIQHRSGALLYMRAPGISAPHAFTTRYGGASRGVFSTLNLAENRGDEKADVCHNYDVLAAALGLPAGGMAFTRQVHGALVRRVGPSDRRMPFDPPAPDADGLVTDVPGLPLVIFTADCIPVLLHDPVRGAVGAVHAGWRGTVSDIAGEGVRALVREFGCDPGDIRAAIGPGISACCFETGDEVPDAVRSALGPDAEAFIASNGKPHVDLKGVNAFLLRRAGVPAENIDVSSECTMCLCGKYWSHRASHGRRGSQGAVIMLER